MREAVRGVAIRGAAAAAAMRVAARGAAVRGVTLGRLPAAGLPVRPQQLLALGLARDEDPAGALRDGLRQRLGLERVSLRTSGRDALRSVLASASTATGRGEVILPAYTCFSVPAAAVASGLRVRLVDVDERGRIDLEALERLPLARAAAVVVCNLFGLPEPLAPIRALAHAAGALVIDDAAQSLGARCEEGPVGGRGDAGVLSFGRGKPLAGLGGGAIAWSVWPGEIPDPPPPSAAPWWALARAAAYNVALRPLVFRALAAIPALGIGETVFDVDFPRGPIDPACMALAATALPALERDAGLRAEEAERLAEALAASQLRPLLAPRGATGVYPRLAVLAPRRAARDAALEVLEGIGAGASAMYPSALDRLPELRPHLIEPGRYAGARRLAGRLLTLPTHGQLQGARLEAVVRALA